MFDNQIYSNHQLLVDQAKKFKPKIIVFGDKSKRELIENELYNLKIEILHRKQCFETIFVHIYVFYSHISIHTRKTYL